MTICNKTIGERNYTIDFVRVIFAVLIVALHTSLFSDINLYLYYFVCHVFSRLAVPFFAAVSGYFFFQNYSGQKALKYLKKLVIAYVFWTTISCVVDIFFGYVDGNIGSFLFGAYITKGQHALWYMLAMIYTVLLTLFVHKFHVNHAFIVAIVLILFILGVLCNAYGNFVERFLVFKWIQSLLSSNLSGGMAFIVIPYFSMGYLLNKNALVAHEDRYYWGLTALFTALFVAKVGIITFSGIHKNNTSCFMTFPLVYFLIRACLRTNSVSIRIEQYFSPIANVLYYLHCILMYSIGSIISSGTLEFVVVCILGCAMGVLLIVMRKKQIKIAYLIT